VDISFDDPKFERVCNQDKLLRRKYGPLAAKVIRRRLDDLDAVTTLEEMKHLPGRCHELLHNRAGQISLDLIHPQRLIFTPSGDVPMNSGGGLDWSKLKAIKIIGIEDTHE
jgi:plasmid maintenance system killer protein